MEITYSRIALTMFLGLLLTACGSENASLLTDGIWTFQDMSTDSEDSAIISVVSLGEALLTGASMEFQESGTFILSSSLVQTPTTGEWQLIGDDKLVLDPENESTSTNKIKSLTKDKLSYSESFTDGQTNSYIVTTTWTR